MEKEFFNNLVQKIGHKFRTFGSGYSDLNNPISTALEDKPLVFAAGVGVSDVVYFILEQIEEGGKHVIIEGGDYAILRKAAEDYGDDLSTGLAEGLYDEGGVFLVELQNVLRNYPKIPYKKREFLIKYECPKCKHKWHEVWSSACDSECPKCETENITPVSYSELS